MHRIDGRSPHRPARARTATPITVSTLTLCGLLAAAGCSSLGNSANASDAKPTATSTSAADGGTGGAGGAGSGGSACVQALSDISKYGPSTVKLLAEGRNAASAAGIQLLVDGLDGAADAAGSPQAKQAIQNLATAYDGFFDLTTDVAAVPLSTLLKDITAVDFVCN